ncbi:MAG TPA: hypothetical protein VJJ52_08120 [Candidatus Nanoarchaeia archaeon]|nr:hypothetical protein [Candidatus Nanoarchaeia archaeon]
MESNDRHKVWEDLVSRLRLVRGETTTASVPGLLAVAVPKKNFLSKRSDFEIYFHGDGRKDFLSGEPVRVEINGFEPTSDTV